MNLILKVALSKNFQQKADSSVHSYFCEHSKFLYETDEEFGGFANVFSSASTHCIVCNDEHSSTPVFSPCLTAVCVEFLGLVVVESVLASVSIKAVFKERVDC